MMKNFWVAIIVVILASAITPAVATVIVRADSTWVYPGGPWHHQIVRIYLTNDVSLSYLRVEIFSSNLHPRRPIHGYRVAFNNERVTEPETDYSYWNTFYPEYENPETTLAIEFNPETTNLISAGSGWLAEYYFYVSSTTEVPIHFNVTARDSAGSLIDGIVTIEGLLTIDARPDSLIFPEVHCHPGDIVTLPVTLKTFHPFGEAYFETVHPEEIVPREISSSSLNVFWGGAGSIPFIFAGDDIFHTDTLPPGEYDLSITFSVDSTVTEGDTLEVDITDGVSTNGTVMGAVIAGNCSGNRALVAKPGKIIVTSSKIEEKNLPTKLDLKASPNPFNISTTISFELPESGPVSLQIFDTQGRLVTELVNGDKGAGVHTTIWNAKNAPSGVYFAKLIAGSKQRSVRMILVK